MKTIIFRLLVGSVLVFILILNTLFSPNVASGNMSLSILSSQAVTCGVECVLYPGCSIKMDCTNGVCVEHAGGRFVCGLIEYTCAEYCPQ